MRVLDCHLTKVPEGKPSLLGLRIMLSLVRLAMSEKQAMVRRPMQSTCQRSFLLSMGPLSSTQPQPRLEAPCRYGVRSAQCPGPMIHTMLSYMLACRRLFM